MIQNIKKFTTTINKKCNYKIKYKIKLKVRKEKKKVIFLNILLYFCKHYAMQLRSFLIFYFLVIEVQCLSGLIWIRERNKFVSIFDIPAFEDLRSRAQRRFREIENYNFKREPFRLLFHEAMQTKNNYPFKNLFYFSKNIHSILPIVQSYIREFFFFFPQSIRVIYSCAFN